jgi:hypothetical protein
MAFTAGYLSGNETIQPEALLGEIVVRSQAETPLLSTLPTFKMTNRVTEWGLDRPFTSTDGVRNIGAPHTNTRLEAADWTQRTPHYEVRPRCIAEIKHFGFRISRSDQRAILAGDTKPFARRSSQLGTTLLNEIENTAMYGQGSPETSGVTNERMTMGLLFGAAWTGLERLADSTLDAISDPYNISIPSDMWSVFYNANRTPLSRRMLYDKVMTRILGAGGDMSTPWIFHAGYGTLGLIADFLQDPSGAQINQRTIDAAAGEGHDFIAYMRMPSGHRVGFRSNRYLHVPGSTFSVNNQDFTPGAPTSPGSVGSVTFQGHQTLIGWEPGTVSIGWYEAPHFVNVPTTGDYAELQAVAEFAVRIKAPLCVAGVGNCGS